MFATTYSCLSETAAKLSVIVFNLSKKKKKKRDSFTAIRGNDVNRGLHKPLFVS